MRGVGAVDAPPSPLANDGVVVGLGVVAAQRGAKPDWPPTRRDIAPSCIRPW